MTTPEDRARLRELLDKATDRLWPPDMHGILRRDSRLGGYVDTADAALLVAAVNALPALLDTLDAIAQSLPDTFYAALPLPTRVERMVEMWRRLLEIERIYEHLRESEV